MVPGYSNASGEGMVEMSQCPTTPSMVESCWQQLVWAALRPASSQDAEETMADHHHAEPSRLQPGDMIEVC